VTKPDIDAETIVDTIAPVNPEADLDSSADFTCKADHNPRCHTDFYDVLMTFTDNSDFAEIYISGDVTDDSASSYYNNINQWIEFSEEIRIPLDTTVDTSEVSKNKTITFKVKDAAGNESNEISVNFRLWRSAPVVNSVDVEIENCTVYN